MEFNINVVQKKYFIYLTSETWWYLRKFRYIFSLRREASPLHWRRTFFSSVRI